MKNLFLIPIFAALLCAVYSAVVAAPRTPNREELYNRYCSGCHGPEGTGTSKGPPLVHMIYHPNHHSDMAFYMAVERGVVSHHWRFGDMPKLEVVKRDEVTEIIRYIRGLQKEAGIF